MSSAVPFDLAGWLTTWRAWLEPVTDRLFDLDDRVKIGTAEEQADVAAAFVARKAIADRLDAVSAAAGRNRDAAMVLAGKPIVDDGGGPVGDDIDDAARLLGAIVDKVDAAITAREGRQRQEAALRTALATDLAVAERLAADLGERQNQLAELRRATEGGRDLAATAATVSKLRADLERAAAERERLLGRWRRLDADLAALADEERAVRELAARCRDKVSGAPPLAVPSVAVITAQERGLDLAALPWPAARQHAAPIVAQIDRLSAALAEARRRFQEPLDRRDDLRGLLQSFRQKAAAKGFGEHPDVDGLYRRAERLLWSAPCDVAAAGRLVDEFVTTVNRLTGAPR